MESLAPARRRSPSALLPAACALLVSACGTEAPVEEGRRPPLVEALPARFGQLPQEERLSGVVRARNQITLRAEISAPVIEVAVRSGDAVERGQTLVRLRDDELRDQLRQAEAALSLTEAQAAEARFRVAELEARESRSRALAAQELTSDVDHEVLLAQLDASRAVADQAAARVRQASATRDERRTAVEKAVVRAPISGRVGRRNVEVGMLVDPGTPLFVLGDLDRVTVEIPLTERMLAFVREGHEVRVRSAALAEPVAAEIARISPFLAEGTFSTVAEIDLANPGGLRPGMFVAVDVLYGRTAEAPLVPVGALWDDPATGDRGVFVLPEQRGSELDPATPESPGTTQPALFRTVEVLAEGREAAGVRGVEPGEWVVTVGHQLLRTGEETQVRVRPTSWAQVLRLQGLQREDLLRQFLDEQRRYAQEHGVRPPDNFEFAGEGSSAASGAAAGGGAGSR